MVTLNAMYLEDLGRVRLQLTDMAPNVPYTLQRSTDDEPAWVDVRGGGNLSTMGVSSVDDYEYTPNVVNYYRVTGPQFYDSFNRVFPVEGALSTTGNVGSYASTPDDPSFDITADFEIRADLELDNWATVQQGIVAKWAFDGDERSYLLTIETSGHLRLFWSPDGTDPSKLDATSSVPVPITSGRLAVRATLNVDFGGTHTRVQFFTGDSVDTVSWTQLGSSQDMVGTTSVYSGSAPLEVGSWDIGTNGLLNGNVYAVQVRDDIFGAIVANPDFTAQTPGTTSFVDSTGKTWTLNGDAEIIEVGAESGFTWGTADTGQDWNLGTSSSGFNIYVDDGVGVIADTNNNGFSVEMTTDQISNAVDAELTYAMSYTSDVLDDELEVNFGIRALDADNYYEALIQFEDNPGHDLDIRIAKRVGGVFTGLTDQITVGSWTANELIFVKFRVVGSQLSLKAWTDSSSEPSTWQLATSDTELTTGTAIHVRTIKNSGDPYEVHVDFVELHSVPATAIATAQITPMQSEVFLKSVAYPLLNQALECVDWEEQTRESRTGFFNVKGRHEILGIADVGSSATFELTFITRSPAANRAMISLLTYGGVMQLQPPGDHYVDCPVDIAGIPEGFVMVGESVQAKPLKGLPIWQWTVVFTKVAASDTIGTVPTTITWELLWQMIGPEGTWQTVWDTWPTWEQLWLSRGNPENFGGGIA